MDTENNLYNLALIVLLVLVSFQAYNMFFSRKEHMNPSLLNHQYVDWIKPYDRDHIPPPQPQTPKFYMIDDDTERSPNQPLTSPILPSGQIPCAPQFDWLVPQSLGAGNRYDDMLWSETSPKMMLRNGCTNCPKYKDNKVFNDSESGLPSMNGAGILESQ
jgi:hypothetical protein